MVTLLEDHTQAWGGDPNQHLIDAKFHILFFTPRARETVQGTTEGTHS